MAVSHKLTEVAKTHIPEYADIALGAKAHGVGCISAEYLRDLIFMDLYGVTYCEHVANSRRAIMGCKGPATAQLRAVES